MPNPRRPSRLAAARLIHQLLDYLTPKERAVLLLRWTGMTNREVAAALGITRTAVGTRFVRARRRLADWPKLQALISPPRGRRHG